MTLEQARKIMAANDTSDPQQTLLAVATVLRFEGVAEPQLLRIAERLEGVADGIKSQP